MTHLKHITAYELKSLMQMQTNKLKIFDVRNADEYQREHIVGAQNIPLPELEKYDLSNIANEDIIIFYCQSGNRTKQCEPKLQQKLVKQVMLLDGGIGAWKRFGGMVNKNKKAPLPIMRQVQIVAGILILLGVFLSFAVSPYLALLSGLIGAGLTFAGITGYCGMANLLVKLPYNQKSNNFI